LGSRVQNWSALEPVISFQTKSDIFMKTTAVRLKVIMKMTWDYCLLECEAKQVMDRYRTTWRCISEDKISKHQNGIPQLDKCCYWTYSSLVWLIQFVIDYRMRNQQDKYNLCSCDTLHNTGFPNAGQCYIQIMLQLVAFLNLWVCGVVAKKILWICLLLIQTTFVNVLTAIFLWHRLQ